MSRTFDLVVIGTGAAGDAVASACASAGWIVAIVDARDFGGTCALRGCDPKKVLLSAAEAVDWVRRMEGKGIRAADAAIDWPALIEFKRTFTLPMSISKRERFAAAGLTCIDGHARFVRANALQINAEEVQARFIVVASGARPAPLPIEGTEHLIDSEQFMDLESLPSRIVFIGGGYIAVEFSNLAASVGIEVTVLEQAPRLLLGFDQELCRQLATYMQSRGIRVLPDHKVQSVVRAAGAFLVRATTAGGEQTFEADLVVHAAGRVPDLADLDLDVGGVEYDASGVAVNAYLQSESNPAVYAAGDAAASGGPPVTPVAFHEGEVVAANLLNGNSREPNYAALPSVVFSQPPLAAVGLNEDEARGRGLALRVSAEDASTWQTARRLALPCYGYKFLIEEETQRILGAHLLGPRSDEAINTIALGMRAGLTATDLDEMVWAYPTMAADFWYMT